MTEESQSGGFNKKQYWLYILKLNQGKYYVGITRQKDPQVRIDQHKNGFYSAQWVKKYGYLETIKVQGLGYLTQAEAEKIENKCTRACMKKWGTDNVRGGDLNYSGRYYARFGGLVPDEAWKTITVIVLLLLIIAVLELRWLLRR